MKPQFDSNDYGTPSNKAEYNPRYLMKQRLYQNKEVDL